MSISRRNLLRSFGYAGLALGLSSCRQPGRTERVGDAESTAPPSTNPSPSPTSTPMPEPKVWRPSAGDVSPEVKRAAVGMVEAAGTWETGDGGARRAAQRLRASGYDPALVTDLGSIVSDDVAATASVVVAQYGGILAEAASVLIVVEQWVRGQDGRVGRHGTTLDVRLVADEPRWVVTNVRAAQPGRRAPTITLAARKVLNNQRVVLPFAAVRDVRAGAIDDSVLVALSSLSEAHRLDVSILRSGHPVRVFGTDRTSNHIDGRAVDIWAIDKQPIIEMGDSRVVADFMRAASAAGAYQVGGPTNLDGLGTAYFSDNTHQDHIHLGFTT